MSSRSTIPIEFEKLSKWDRHDEPFKLAIPWPRGHITDAEAVSLNDEGEPLPLQRRVTSRWADGSVRWMLLRSQVDLPGGAGKTITLSGAGDDDADSEPVTDTGTVRVTVTVSQVDRAWVIDTGPLEVIVSKDDELIHDIRFHGNSTGWFLAGLELELADGSTYTVDGRDLTVQITECGPLFAQVSLDAPFRSPDGEAVCSSCIRINAHAGKPYLRIEQQLIQDSGRDIDVASLGARIERRTGPNDVKLRLGEGYYRTNVETDTEAVSHRLDQETILYQSNEHVEEVFYGDYWIDQTNADVGLTASIHQAHQQFPKGLDGTPSEIAVWLVPPAGDPLTWRRGVAKTHRIQLYCHASELAQDQISHRSLQFQLPDMPVLPPDVYRRAGVWEPVFPERTIPVLERALMEGVDNRAKGLGIFHFGDGPDVGYTAQGRGEGDIVWTNNEYDFPHAMFLQWARTGERRPYDIARAAVRHWMDVDVCHDADDLFRQNAQIIHSAHHVTGGVTPSHEWVEGLLDYFHLTGRDEAKATAIRIGENMRYHYEEKFGEVGTYSVRETGWALRAFAALYAETHDEEWLALCHDIADGFREWREAYGGFLAPYTDHTEVRVPFMIGIALSSLMRYYWLTGDEEIATIIVAELRDLVEHAQLDDGLFYYKELPSLQRRAASANVLEALAYGYQLSSDADLVAAGIPTLQRMQAGGMFAGGGRPSGVKEPAGAGIVKGYGGAPGPKAFGQKFVPVMMFYRALLEADLADKLDGS